MNKENKPYRACDDNELHNGLYSLNRGCIHPLFIETDGSILFKLSDRNDLDIRIDAQLDEQGVWLRHGQHLPHGLTISDETLLQLAAMSACFAAGHAKARQEADEKARQEKNDDET